jgi:tetratricopeptide (TPR) repeat protein
MPKQNRKVIQPQPANSSPGALIAGAVCLAVGLLIGFYFGKISSRPAVSPGPSGPVAAVPDPTAFVQTEAALKAILDNRPGDLQTLIRLGNLYYDNNRFQEAADYYGRALEHDPRNVPVRTDRGTCYWNLGKPDAAIADFQKSLEVDPAHAQTLFNLGVVYLHGKNDPVQAKAAWQKLLAANPAYPEKAKVQEMIASLSGAPQSGRPSPSRQGTPGSAGMEELMQRLKKPATP